VIKASLIELLYSKLSEALNFPNIF
jgi:hypothetical protein